VDGGVAKSVIANLVRLALALGIAIVVLASDSGRLIGQEAAESAGTPFLARDGVNLVLDGGDFRFVGSNLYNAAGDPNIYECGPWMSQPDAELSNWFSHARTDYGATVIRFWAYQTYTQGGTNWQALDRVFGLAQEYGLHVIPVLENQWPECTQGGYKTASWYATSYTSPYGGYALSYRDYVGRVVQRYRADPAILGWALMNEAESKTSAGTADPESLYAFARDMSAYIKALDPNHLVMLGVIGGAQPGVAGSNYARLLGLDTIDIAEFHDYLADDAPLPGAAYPGDPLGVLATASGGLGQAMRSAAEAQKPIVVSEAGMTTCLSINGSTVQTPDSRASRFAAKLGAFFGAGGAGYLIWAWHPTDDCSFNFTVGDPLNRVLAQWATLLANGSN
jgi:mannan endo-1,4-beta-mannosidase